MWQFTIETIFTAFGDDIIPGWPFTFFGIKEKGDVWFFFFLSFFLSFFLFLFFVFFQILFYLFLEQRISHSSTFLKDMRYWKSETCFKYIWRHPWLTFTGVCHTGWLIAFWATKNNVRHSKDSHISRPSLKGSVHSVMNLTKEKL